jgi:outer membrane protein OmpA-like peptidoglycan-associated protein
MKNYTKIAIVLFLGLLNLANVQAQTEVKDRFLDTLRVGIRYQVQEFHMLNQKLLDNCNCDESLRLKERALQGISASLYEPLSKHWAFGGDIGGTFGTVMDDNRNYTKYTFFQMRAESFYNFFSPKSKLRPYLSGSIQMAANASQAFLSLPLGAGLRYQLMKGGYVHIQTAYDRGFSSKLAKNMITNVGFHVPLHKRKEYKEEPSSALYAAKRVENKPATTTPSTTPSTVSPSTIAPSVAPSVQQEPKKPELLRVVYFDTDKYSLNKVETAKVLAEVKAFVNQYPDVQIYLTGHTDSVLDVAYNMALSKKRVQAVFDWLKSQGIPAESISTEFYGKSDPATSNDTESGRASNRRVVILVK